MYAEVYTASIKHMNVYTFLHAWLCEHNLVFQGISACNHTHKYNFLEAANLFMVLAFHTVLRGFPP